MLTRSLRKAYIFLESVSLKDDIYVNLRVNIHGKGHTYYCTPIQAINHMVCSDKDFVWLKVD